MITPVVQMLIVCVLRQMDAKYQHPSIHLYMMDPKAPLLTEAGASDNGSEEEEDVSNPGEDEDPGVKSEPCCGSQEASLDDWEIRRCYGCKAS
jgi:hypothetical protein